MSITIVNAIEFDGYGYYVACNEPWDYEAIGEFLCRDLTDSEVQAIEDAWAELKTGEFVKVQA